MTDFTPTPRTTLRRRTERASYERATVEAILDEAFLCHVATQVDGETACVPMVYARVGDALILHGSVGNRVLRALRDGARACVTVALVDAVVLGRSAFRSSVNYRSVVVYGTAREVSGVAAKRDAMRGVVNHVIPERFDDVRPPAESELAQILVLELPLVEVSAKVRSGPPADEEEDYAREVWAGILPVRLEAAAPVDDPRLLPGLEPPVYAREWSSLRVRR